MTDQPCSSPEARQLDFWLGDWDLTWPAEQTGGEAGETQTGANHITRLFGQCVIEEDFATDDGAFLGRSLSVFDEAAALWRQTWVDNSGGYIALTGGKDGEHFELHTEPAERDGRLVVNRMVFSEITTDSLLWSWQTSPDDGATWRDLWTIDYRRRA
jgi:Protein of unknown function (DUF1579)